jgi:hypothetical protein
MRLFEEIARMQWIGFYPFHPDLTDISYALDHGFQPNLAHFRACPA